MKDLVLPAHFSFPTYSYHLFIACCLCLGMLLALPVAQAQQRHCGTMEHLEEQLESNPNMLYNLQRIERSTQLVAKSMGSDNRLIRIPVVVHIVHHTESQNISQAQILSQLDVLNEDFQRLNPDRIDTDPLFTHAVGNPHIQFELAQYDPQGNPTTGITRHLTNRTVFYSSNNAIKYSAMGGVDAWPTGDYLNIWIGNLGSGILGYSQFPGGPSETDGVVIGYRFFGTTGPVRPPFNQGRTTTHEVGHWLNLRHIWGDGPCGADDLVEDTPLAERPHHGCVRSAESCGSADMVQNFMDYTDDACMNLFSNGQAGRMRALFSPGGSRESLLHSPAIIQQVQEPVLAFYPPARLEVQNLQGTEAVLNWEVLPEADFYRVRLRAEGGQWATRSFQQNFVNTSRLLSCTEYEWQVEAVQGELSSGFSPSHRFNTQGCGPVVQVSEDGGATPSNLQAYSTGEQQARVSWQAVAGAQNYHLQYKEAGSRRIYSKVSSSPETSIFGLRSGVRYLYRVRATFPYGAGAYSPVSTFTPGTQAQLSRLRQAAPGTDGYLRVYPDAQSRSIQVEYDVWEEAPVLISILSPEGRTLKVYDPFLPQAGQFFELDVQELNLQNFTLQIEDADGFVHQANASFRN